MPLSAISDDERQAVLHGGREFLAVHEEIAVAGDADDGALRIEPLHGHGRRHAVTHRARSRGDMLAETAEAVEAMNPSGVVSGAVAEDGVGREVFAQPHHDCAEIDRARLLGRLLRPGKIVGMSGRRLTARRRWKLEAIERCGERRRRRVDRQMRAVDAAELLGARMDMHERHLRPRNIEQRVALRRQFAHPAADQDHEVGGLDPLRGASDWGRCRDRRRSRDEARRRGAGGGMWCTPAAQASARNARRRRKPPATSGCRRGSSSGCAQRRQARRAAPSRRHRARSPSARRPAHRSRQCARSACPRAG